ncbi:MAG: pyridoxal-phosphate dependent enzyme, partial [Acidobacteriaceae bacterium]
IRKYLDDIVTVSEEEIAKAMTLLARNPRTVAEPSGAVSVAAFLFHRDELPKTVFNVAVISGGNIDAKLLAQITETAPPRI